MFAQRQYWLNVGWLDVCSTSFVCWEAKYLTLGQHWLNISKTVGQRWSNVQKSGTLSYNFFPYTRIVAKFPRHEKNLFLEDVQV